MDIYIIELRILPLSTQFCPTILDEFYFYFHSVQSIFKIFLETFISTHDLLNVSFPNNCTFLCYLSVILVWLHWVQRICSIILTILNLLRFILWMRIWPTFHRNLQRMYILLLFRCSTSVDLNVLCGGGGIDFFLYSFWHSIYSISPVYKYSHNLSISLSVISFCFTYFFRSVAWCIHP